MAHLTKIVCAALRADHVFTILDNSALQLEQKILKTEKIKKAEQK